VVVTKSTIFWDITPCSLLNAFTLVSCSAHFFDTEDGADTFPWNVGWHSTDYTVLYPRRWHSSWLFLLPIVLTQVPSYWIAYSN
jgi:hypothetical protein